MDIYQFQILNPIIDKKKPHIDKYGVFIIPKIMKYYNYFLECCRFNNNIGFKEYFILLGYTKFNVHAKKCHVDNYGRLKLNVAGDIKDYITNEVTDRGNINVEYLSSETDYDIYKIS